MSSFCLIHAARSASPLLLSLALLTPLACTETPDGTTDASESDSSDSESSSSSASATGATTGSNTGTSNGSNGSNISGTMSTTVASTGGDTSSSGTTEPDPMTGSTGEPTTGPVCELDYEPGGFSCETDSDCAIAGDCCGCVAYNPNMGSPGNCGGMCQQDKCAEWGLTEAACENNQCVVKGKSCDLNDVSCDAPEPQCEDGELPQVLDNCYTGECLPVEACDRVPDCSYCEQIGNNCKITNGGFEGCAAYSCFPDFPECFGGQTCGCLSPFMCTAPFTTCADISEGVIECS